MIINLRADLTLILIIATHYKKLKRNTPALYDIANLLHIRLFG